MSEENVGVNKILNVFSIEIWNILAWPVLKITKIEAFKTRMDNR